MGIWKLEPTRVMKSLEIHKPHVPLLHAATANSKLQMDSAQFVPGDWQSYLKGNENQMDRGFIFLWFLKERKVKNSTENDKQKIEGPFSRLLNSSLKS